MIGYERHGVGALDPWKLGRCQLCGDEIYYMCNESCPEYCEECEQILEEEDIKEREEGEILRKL